MNNLKNINKTVKAYAQSANKKFFEKSKNKHIHKRQVMAATAFLLVVLTLPVFSVSFGAKEVELTVDGKTYTETTHKATTDAFIDQVKSEHDLENYKSENTDSKMLKDNTDVILHSKKTVDITNQGKTQTYTTYQDTVGEFLKEQGFDDKDLTLTGADEDTLLVDDNKFSLDNESTKTKKEVEKTDLPVKYVDNDNLEAGKKVVKVDGTPKKVQNTYELTYKNGKQIDKKLTSSKTIDEGKQKVVEVGTKEQVEKPETTSSTSTTPQKQTDTSSDKVVQAKEDSSKRSSSAPKSTTTTSSSSSTPKTSTSSSGSWDKLASCESGGNWSANTGNGYYGGLQITKETWDANKGAVGVTADYPYQASKADQIAVASHIQESAGWSQWGACASQAGLS